MGARLFQMLLICGTLVAAPLSVMGAEGRSVALELVLALDLSGSVSDKEFNVQVDGIAAAFRDPDVVNAVRALGSDGLAVAVVGWSGIHMQAVMADWTLIDDHDSAAGFANLVAKSERVFVDSTSIGGAILFSLEQLETNRFQGRRRVIDVSGDGFSNEGPDVPTARAKAIDHGVTINGLVIGRGDPLLRPYYRHQVIGGPGAFVEQVDLYSDFPDAIRRKLIREILGLNLASTR